MKTKVRTKAIPISAAMLAELHKYSPGEGEIDMDKLPASLRKKLLDMAGEAIASDEDDDESGCPGCDAELAEQYERRVPAFVRDMIDTVIKAKNYAPEKHNAAMRNAMQKAVAQADAIDSDTDDQSDIATELKGLLDALVERLNTKSADENVAELKAGDNALATLLRELEKRVKARPELLRDENFVESVKHQVRVALMDSIVGEVLGKTQAKPEPEYEPQYKVICEQVIVKKAVDGTKSRVFQQFVAVDADSSDAFDDRVFNELKAELNKIAPYDKWEQVETGDEMVAAIRTKVKGDGTYIAKQIGRKLRIA